MILKQNMNSGARIAGIIGLMLLLPGVALALSPISNFPADRREAGNIFIQAFNELHVDSDSFGDVNHHPLFLDTLLADAPNFVLEHIIEHTSFPNVALRASRVWVHRDGVVDKIPVLKKLEAKWKTSFIKYQFAALRVVVKDDGFVKQLLKRCNASSETIKIEAAGILALAGNNVGQKLLTEHVKECGFEIGLAATFMSACQSPLFDDVLLEALTKTCDAKSVSFALGQRAFKKLYPLHFDMLERRDALGARYQSQQGMYAAWFDMSRFAKDRGVVEVIQLVKFIERFRNYEQVWPGRDLGVYKRYMDTLVGFLNTANHHLKVKSNTPIWPKTYEMAKHHLRLKNNTEKDAFNKRVSASVSVCQTGAAQLHFSRATYPVTYSVLTARGDRIHDGAFNTRFYIMTQKALHLQWKEAISIEEMWISFGCKDASLQHIKSVAISGKLKDGKGFSVNQKVTAENQYFQPISIMKTDVKSMKIHLSASKSNQPLCISEIRFVPKK